MKKLFRAIFLVILAITTMLTTLIFTAKHFFGSPMILYSYMTTSEYDAAVKNSVLTALEDRQMVYSIDVDKVKDVIDFGTVQYESRQVLRSIADHIINNGDFEQADYQSTVLYNVVEEEINRLAKEYSETPKDTAVTEVYSLICDIINNEIDMMSESYYNQIPTISKYTVYFNSAYLTLALGVISLLALAYMYRHRVFYMVYKIFGAVWVGAAFVAIPFGVVYYFDLLKNFSMQHSPLSVLIKSVYNSFVENIFVAGTLVLIIATIFLVLSIFLMLRNKSKRSNHRHHKKSKRGGYNHKHSKKSKKSEEPVQEHEEVEKIIDDEKETAEEKVNFIDIEDEINRVNQADE